MAEEFNPDVFTLIDEDGVEVQFELLERAEFEGKEYFALIPVEKNPDFEDGEYVILRLEEIEGSDEAPSLPLMTMKSLNVLPISSTIFCLTKSTTTKAQSKILSFPCKFGVDSPYTDIGRHILPALFVIAQ